MYKVQSSDLNQGSGWTTSSEIEDLEEASAVAYGLSALEKDCFVRVFDDRLECVVEAYHRGKLISAGPLPVREQLSPEFARAMLALFERHGEALRRLANGP